MPKKTEEKKDSVKEEGVVRKSVRATTGFVKKHKTKVTVGLLSLTAVVLGAANASARSELKEARRSKDESATDDGPTLEVVDEIA